MKNINLGEIKYVVYARRSIEKSDKEERVVSTESQIKELKELAINQNLKIVKIFQETKSAKRPYARPEFAKMIEMVNDGKADGILCWKMDRLARNAVDEGTIKYLLQEGVLKNIKSTDRDWFPDDNVLMASVEFGVATQYSRDLSKHIKRGMRARAESGVRPCLAPLGYKNSRYHVKNSEEILVDEEMFPLVRKLFDYALTCRYTPTELLDIANNKLGIRMRFSRDPKGKKMSKSNIFRVLRNPFYYGYFEYPEYSGNVYKGNHKTMITEDEYNTIQTIMSDKPVIKPKTHNFAYTGLIKCGVCGGGVTAEEKWSYQQNGNVHHYIYYRCIHKADYECKEKAVREEVIDKGISDYLQKIEIPDVFHRWAIETLKEMHNDEKNDRNNILHKSQERYDDVVKRIDMLLELRLAQEISPIEYSSKKLSLEEEKTEYKKQLDNVDGRIDTWLKSLDESLTFAEKAKSVFEDKNTTVSKKRAILSSLGYKHQLIDQKFNVVAEKPLLAIQEAAFEAQSISEQLETTKYVDKQQHLNELYTKSPTMWRWWYRNHMHKEN